MGQELYERDYVAWLSEQANALKRLQAERVNLPLDLGLLAEELDDMGRELRGSCASFVILILQHLLKLEHSPAGEPRRGWRVTVRTARANLTRRITATIAGEIEQDLEELYRAARGNAVDELLDHHESEAADQLPKRCPYTLDQIRDADWWPARSTLTP